MMLKRKATTRQPPLNMG